MDLPGGGHRSAYSHDLSHDVRGRVARPVTAGLHHKQGSRRYLLFVHVWSSLYEDEIRNVEGRGAGRQEGGGCWLPSSRAAVRLEKLTGVREVSFS